MLCLIQIKGLNLVSGPPSTIIEVFAYNCLCEFTHCKWACVCIGIATFCGVLFCFIASFLYIMVLVSSTKALGPRILTWLP